MCQHNKEFDEWWSKQVGNSSEWTTLERLAAKDAWEAATKIAVEKFTSTNRQSTPCSHDSAAWHEKLVCDDCGKVLEYL
jgi:hypothetical protein